MPRHAMNKACVPESKYDRTPPQHETLMSNSEYTALLQAARSKGKLDAFYKWQYNRKIILKG